MDEHLTRDLFRSVAHGDLHPRAVSELGLAHLLALCPHCRAEFEAWRRQARTGSEPADYDRAFARLQAALAPHVADRERAARAAQRDLEELLALAPGRRAVRVERARRRFRGDALARLLLDRSWEIRRHDPAEAFHLAELARSIVHRSPASSSGFELVALATAYMANARRAAGDLVEADAHLRFARSVVHREQIEDLATLARIDDLEGSLRKDRRQLAEAQGLLERAAKLYHLLRDAAAQVRALIKLGDVLHERGASREAIAITERALDQLTTDPDPFLYLCARYNLAHFCLRSGDPERTAMLLAEDRPLYESSTDPAVRRRYGWLCADLARARGDRAAAEAGYLAVRDGFIAAGIGYDAAIVSLDLAVLYLEDGRNGEVRELAETMIPIFEAQDVHREALAALLLFQEAARHEALTAAIAREVGKYLREARTDPDRQFQAPS